jgi:hypothetical protein
VEIHGQHGVELDISTPAEEAAVNEFWRFLAAKKIQVFASLDGLLAATGREVKRRTYSVAVML